MNTTTAADTRGQDYADRLTRLPRAGLKRFLPTQLPYRWNIRRLRPGFTLDVGCGIGRNLVHLDGNGVGVDHNADAVRVAGWKGLCAYTPEQFLASRYAVADRFDSLLLAHVAEHMTEQEATDLVRSYLPYVRPGGRVIFITPQERGFRSDATHVDFVDFDALDRICSALGLAVERRRSFPLPRGMGRAFTYNEFVVVARRV